MIHVYEKRTNFADMNHVHYRKILNTDSNLFAAIIKKKGPIYKRNSYLNHILITDILK